MFLGHSNSEAYQPKSKQSLPLKHLSSFNGVVARFCHRHPRVFSAFIGSVGFWKPDFSRQVSRIQRFEGFSEFGDSGSESEWESQISIHSRWKNRLRSSGHYFRRRRYTALTLVVQFPAFRGFVTWEHQIVSNLDS